MSVTNRNTKALLDLLKIPENRVCFDCGTREPRWCSLAFGVFICIRCAGLHRRFSTKVKSIDLDNWDDYSQVQIMLQMGNLKAQEIYVTALRTPSEQAPNKVIEDWLDNKYRPNKNPTREAFPKGASPVFKEPVKALNPPPLSSNQRPTSPTSVQQPTPPPPVAAAVVPQAVRPPPPVTKSNSRADLNPPPPATLVNVPAPSPAPALPPLSQTPLEPSNRHPQKAEIMSLYNKPLTATKPEQPLTPSVINAKPLKSLKSTPNYDVIIGGPTPVPQPQPQYFQPYAVPIYNMPPQPYYQPQVIVVQNPYPPQNPNDLVYMSGPPTRNPNPGPPSRSQSFTTVANPNDTSLL